MLALGSMLATGAGAAPLPTGVDPYVLVAAPATECSATDSAAPGICAASTEALMAYATTGKWGKPSPRQPPSVWTTSRSI
jgi:hypothetical protein